MFIRGLNSGTSGQQKILRDSLSLLRFNSLNEQETTALGSFHGSVHLSQPCVLPQGVWTATVAMRYYRRCSWGCVVALAATGLRTARRKERNAEVVTGRQA